MAARPKKPRRGRPPLGDDGLSRVVSLKLSNNLHAAWQAAATRCGMTLSEYVRESVEMAIARGSSR